jgi:hypothetical protein
MLATGTQAHAIGQSSFLDASRPRRMKNQPQIRRIVFGSIFGF